MFVCSTINTFVFYLEGGLENTRKRTETREKSLWKTWFQLGMGLKKVQKQGRDERMQGDYPISALYFCRCQVVFLRSFISALFLYFSQPHYIPNWNKVLQNLLCLITCTCIYKPVWDWRYRRFGIRWTIGTSATDNLRIGIWATQCS